MSTGFLFEMAPDPIEGFRYRRDFLTEPEEGDLLRSLQTLELNEFRMHGVVAKRRVMHYGWSYGYERLNITPGPPIPDFLAPLQSRLADFAGLQPEALAEALVTEYRVGAGIGWHRDAPMFGLVAAVSLSGACRMRFRRGTPGNWEYREWQLEPRSAYIISETARSEWQHSIPATRNLRYSITFRTIRRKR